MSFWESLKPAKRPPQVTGAELSADQRTLSLTFSDGVREAVSARALRQFCPCAECVEEWTGRRTYDPDAVPADMKLVEVVPVGNYALSFTFGDLHRTGIFNWEYLRRLATSGGAP
ncbi:MAG: DUF971 domain-containing protein [Myxococcaceae bacterium]|jgi:DUF971 family protein|nr:DUF971 domain-containing protein [Myxococcaceae bacterium]